MEENKDLIETNNSVPSVTGARSIDQLDVMQNIADSNYTPDVMALTDSNLVKNQMKLFLISECKRELQKVISYSKMLDVIEDRFQERFINNINEVPDNQLPQLMQLMMGCIDRSNNLINSILKDEEVLNLLVIQNNNFDKEEIASSSQILARLYNSIPDSVNQSSIRSKIVEQVVGVLNNLGEVNNE